MQNKILENYHQQLSQKMSSFETQMLTDYRLTNFRINKGINQNLSFFNSRNQILPNRF